MPVRRSVPDPYPRYTIHVCGVTRRLSCENLTAVPLTPVPPCPRVGAAELMFRFVDVLPDVAAEPGCRWHAAAVFSESKEEFLRLRRYARIGVAGYYIL